MGKSKLTCIRGFQTFQTLGENEDVQFGAIATLEQIVVNVYTNFLPIDSSKVELIQQML